MCRYRACLMVVMSMAACGGGGGVGLGEGVLGSDLGLLDVALDQTTVDLGGREVPDMKPDIEPDLERDALADLPAQDGEEEVEDVAEDGPAETLDLPPDPSPDLLPDLPMDLPSDEISEADGVTPVCRPEDCHDGDPCTHDECQGGICLHVPFPGCAPEWCRNGVDDNGDLRIDCDDPQCDREIFCLALHNGDVCRKALEVHDGQPVTEAMAGQTLSYRGDMKDMEDQYRPACAAETGGPDMAWRLVLGAPMRVLAHVDFDGEDPATSPGAVLTIYRDDCRPVGLLDCAAGGAGEAVIDRPLPPGDYLYVVDSTTLPTLPAGPYDISFTFEAPPRTEALCGDRLDDDLDGETDCLDQDCQGDPSCQGCAVEAVLSCGDTVHGVLTGEDDADWYAFRVERPTNVAVYFGPEAGGTDRFNLQFKEGDPGRSCDDLYTVGEVTIWHTTNPQGAGFLARAGQDYRVRLDAGAFQSGAYRMHFLCETDPESACGDGVDNDADSWVDCEDEDCSRSAACTGGHDAESCTDPMPIGRPDPISLAAVGTRGLHWTQVLSTWGMGDDLAAPCAPLSDGGPDMTLSFSLADRMAVSLVAESRESPEKTPAIYVIRAPCLESRLQGCGDRLTGLAFWSAVLGPGSYVVVIDAGSRGADGRGEPVTVQLDAWFDAVGTPEVCDDGVDQDQDGWTDCEDPGCFADVACTGGRSGEDCSDAFLLNGGQALMPGTSVNFHNTTRGRRNDLSLSCSPWSQIGGDTVHAIVLAEEAVVTAQVRTSDGTTPAVALFAPGCGPLEEQACGVGTDSFLMSQVSATLPAGTAYVAVDAGDGFLSRPWDADYTLEVVAVAP